MIRARINHGNRGTSLFALARSYELEYAGQYYDMIVESYENGNHDQCIEQFNRMKAYDQKYFLRNVGHMGYVLGEQVLYYIIDNL